MLANAVAELKPPRSQRADTRAEARAWFAGPKGTWWMCLLGYDPDAFREGLRRKGMM